jgi:hypothetical protein
LKETHPELFEAAKCYESSNKVNGNAFYWSGNESLEQLEKPERMQEIKANWKKTQEKNANASDKLVHILGSVDEDDSDFQGCLVCHI